jgi:RNA polymerase sigma-70 factor (ECF subfamily)
VTTPDPRGAEDGGFESTSWTVVANAADPASPRARQALGELCRSYWYPLYVYVRRRGYSADRAEDLTQAFFTDLLARGSIGAADRSRGRFRTFLLAALEHFLANTHDRERRIKRGGGVMLLSIDARDAEDRYLREPAHGMTPERLYQRRWALTLLDRTLKRLEREMSAPRQRALFERLKPTLMGTPDGQSHADVGAALGLNEGAVRVAAHRLRKRYRALLHDEIAQTVADPGAVEEEINELFLALRPEAGAGSA